MLPPLDDDEALRWLARAARIRPDARHDALGVLREELRRHNVRVSRLHAKLFTSRCWNQSALPVCICAV